MIQLLWEDYKIYFRSVSVGFLLFQFTLFSYGQDSILPGNLQIKGWVIHNERGLNDADVLLWRNDSVLQRINTGPSGYFKFSIPLETEILASFSQGNLISKKILINTLTHQKMVMEKNFSFEFEVELLDDRPSVLKDFYNFPVAVVYFDTLALDFSYYRSTIEDYLAHRRTLLTYSIGLVFDYELVNHNFPNLLAVINSIPAAYNLARNDELTPVIASSRYADQMVSHEEGPEIKKYKELENELLAISPEIPVPEPVALVIKNYSRPGNPGPDVGSVFFSVQLLATERRVPRNFFARYKANAIAGDVFWYKDGDGLDKYIVGEFKDIDATMNAFRRLKEMGYDGYIVAFHNYKRIRVIEAQRLLGQKP